MDAQATAVWEAQPGETAQAHQAFLLYRDLEPTARSIPRVGQECAKSTSLLKRWSAQWQWVARAHAWDAHCQALADDAHIEAVKEFRRKAVLTATYTHNKVMERVNEDGFFAALSGKVVLDYLKYSVELEAIGLCIDLEGGDNADPGNPTRLCKLYSGIDVSQM